MSRTSFGCVSTSFSEAMTFVAGFPTINVMIQLAKPIMIVDDEPDITHTVKKIFQKNGIVTDSFNDPEEALSHFTVGIYALLILDIGMRKMNGFELHREIRKIDTEVKVCFFSAYETYGQQETPTPPTEIRCVIKKPIRMAELVRHVRLEITSLVA